MSNTVNVAEVLEMLKNNAKTKGGNKVRNNVKYVKMIPENLDGVQFPPQCIELIGILLNSSEDEWKEPELMELINSYKEISKKQEPWKIFQYYRKNIIEAGFLKMIKE